MKSILDWSQFALLLIDVQNDFWSADFVDSFPQFPENITRLLQFCRTEGIEVVHVRALFQPDMSDWMERYKLSKRIPCVAGTEGALVTPFAQELPGEKVIIKHSFDGFLTPDLLPHLQGGGKRFLLTAGLITSTCVLFTTAGAMQRGFLTAVVEDCCADDPLTHEHTLDNYRFIFSRTKSTLLSDHHAQWQEQLDALAALEHSRQVSQ